MRKRLKRNLIELFFVPSEHFKRKGQKSWNEKKSVPVKIHSMIHSALPFHSLQFIDVTFLEKVSCDSIIISSIHYYSFFYHSTFFLFSLSRFSEIGRFQGKWHERGWYSESWWWSRHDEHNQNNDMRKERERDGG